MGSPASVVVHSTDPVVSVAAFEPQPLSNSSTLLLSSFSKASRSGLTLSNPLDHTPVASSALINITIRNGSAMPDHVTIIDMVAAERGRARIEVREGGSRMVDDDTRLAWVDIAL